MAKTYEEKHVAPAAQPVYVAVILDRSGSMETIRNDVIGGFNTFLAEQKSIPGVARLVFTQFDTEYEVRYDGDLHAAEPLSRETFVPRGGTALYDAIGRTLNTVETAKPDKAIICIITDGHENSSKEFKQAQIKEKIEAAEKRGWQVLYLAANQDAFAVGVQFGIRAQNATTYSADAAGVAFANATMSASVRSYRGA
jgi:Mg-chelatase subunit ChlD